MKKYCTLYGEKLLKFFPFITQKVPRINRISYTITLHNIERGYLNSKINKTSGSLRIIGTQFRGSAKRKTSYLSIKYLLIFPFLTSPNTMFFFLSSCETVLLEKLNLFFVDHQKKNIWYWEVIIIFNKMESWNGKDRQNSLQNHHEFSICKVE